MVAASCGGNTRQQKRRYHNLVSEHGRGFHKSGGKFAAEEDAVWRVLKSEKKEYMEVPKVGGNFVELALECIKTF